jgi:DeoR family fructose operon transcriptional repressor
MFGYMLEQERHHLILEIVAEPSSASVGDLVELLESSVATIRRDINARRTW